MRRILCWFMLLVVITSLFPSQAFAEEVEPVEKSDLNAPETPGPISENMPPTTTELPSPSLPLKTTPSLTITTPETTPATIMTTVNVSSTVEFIEFLNQSDNPIDMSQLFVIATAGDQTCSVALAETGYLLPGDYITSRSPSSHTGSVYVLNRDCGFSMNISRLELYYQGSRIQLIDGITNGNWLRHAGAVKTNTKTTLDCTHKAMSMAMKQTGSVGDYVKCSGVSDLIEGSLYVPPLGGGLKITEILPNSRSCLPSDTSPDCSDYIKVKNTSHAAINLAGYRLRSGAKYSNATISTSFNWQEPTLNPERDELLLPAGKYFLLRLRNDGQVLGLPVGGGNVWVEDYFGVKAYDEASYPDMDLAAASGRSWAYNEPENAWKFGIPSPYGDNSFPEIEPGKGSGNVPSGLKPCRDDQYRSEETNRCRNITSANTPAPCKEGQYRSEETNRCRSIASAAVAVLKPCADDQFRSPITNRCRKIASNDDIALADCGEGRERNPETHRCRNVKDSKVPDAAFAVAPIKETGKAFIGWWALGGVGLLALGYGVWEWRTEIRSGIRKVRMTLFSKSSH